MANQIIDRDFGYARLITDLDELGQADDIGVYVGFRARSGGADLLVKAAANEFGTETIPERSFLRSTVDDERETYVRELTKATGQIVDGEITQAETTLKRLGLRAVGDVQMKIVDLREPPNAPATIAAKKSSNPLIDTGNMRQSVEYVLIWDGEIV